MTRVELSDLKIGKRHRAIDKNKVASLARSMEALGLQQPISIYFDDDAAAHLVAGLHRVKAAKSLGWEHIDCLVVDLDELDRELWEIDENLMRADLSKDEKQAHLTRRKQLWEKRQSAHGAPIESKRTDGKGHRPKGFAADTAAETGLSKSQINRLIAKPKQYTAKPLPKPRSGKPVIGLEAARRHYLDLCTGADIDIDAEIDLVTDALREIAGKKTNGADLKLEPRSA